MIPQKLESTHREQSLWINLLTTTTNLVYHSDKMEPDNHAL